VLLNGKVLLLTVPSLVFVDSLFISSFINIPQSLQQVFLNDKRNKWVLCYQRLSEEGWFFPVPICVKSKFNQSYKDIEDEKFNEVVEYIEFLKNNPS
jgi:hypothetical protein